MRLSGIRRAHLELYGYLKHCDEKGEQFTKENMYSIYDRFVSKKKRGFNEQITVEQKYVNASSWLNKSLAILIRRGYLGLTFERESGEVKCLTEL